MEEKNPNSNRGHKRGRLRSEVRYGSSFRTQVVEEYLDGEWDQRVVAARHGISQTSLCLWIKAYLAQKETGMSKSPPPCPESLSAQQAELNRLRKELEAEKLRTLALEELIDVAEQQFKLQIRKKPGARQ